MERILVLILILFFATNFSYGMHLAEGILSIEWVILWFVLAIPFVVWGVYLVTKRSKEIKGYLSVLGLLGSVVFVLTSLPIPSPVAGSVSHPAAVGISTVVVGPIPSIVLGFITLVIQALFMAHGGITTLGANTFAMAVIGSFAAFAFYKIARLIRLNYFIAGFMAGFAADFFTYLTTAFQLALQIHGSENLFSVWLGIFALFIPIQLPISVIEGIIAGIVISKFASTLPNYIAREVEVVNNS